MDDDGNYHMLNNTDITLHDVGVESEQVNYQHVICIYKISQKIIMSA